MKPPKTNEFYLLPSGMTVKLVREHINESFSCAYINARGEMVVGRALAPGCTLNIEFLMMYAKKVVA